MESMKTGAVATVDMIVEWLQAEIPILFDGWRGNDLIEAAAVTPSLSLANQSTNRPAITDSRLRKQKDTT